MTLTSNITAVRKISVVQAEVEGCWCWHLFTGRQGTGKRLELGRGVHTPNSLNVKSVYIVECTEARSFFQEEILPEKEIGRRTTTTATRTTSATLTSAPPPTTTTTPYTTSATTTSTTTTTATTTESTSTTTTTSTTTSTTP